MVHVIVGLPVSRVGYLSSHCTVRTVPAATGKFSVELRGSTRFQAGFSPVQGPFSVGHTFLVFSGSKDVSPVHCFSFNWVGSWFKHSSFIYIVF